MDTYLVADLTTDLAAALATTDLIHDFATIDLATGVAAGTLSTCRR